MSRASTPMRAGTVRATQPNGWWGMVVLVATESALFGTLFATYFYLRFTTLEWPPAGVEAPATTIPLALTGVLVTTSVPLQLASLAAAGGRAAAARAALAAALLVQSGYFAMQMHLFLHDLEELTPAESAYGSIYYTLLGAHHAHVFAGLLLVAWLLLRLRSGLTHYRMTAVRATALYWHAVNLLALFVTGAVLSPAI